jgi:hypothetical protein
MKWLLAGCAAVALSSGAAFAGPCSEQIAALQQSLSSRDAGAGPVQMKAGSGVSSQISEAGSSVRNTSEASRSAAEVRATGVVVRIALDRPTQWAGRPAGPPRPRRMFGCNNRVSPPRLRPRKTVPRRRPWERTSCKRYRPILIARAVWMGRTTADARRIWLPIETQARAVGVPAWIDQVRHL